MSEAEIHVLSDRLHGGLINKAKRGELEIPLPTGFVYLENGKIAFDPDIQVQKSFKELFQIFKRVGSVTGVVKFFRKNGLKFPLRIRIGNEKGNLIWNKLTHSQALRILHNPRYAGSYAFGKTRTTKLPNGKYQTKRLPKNEWEVFIPNVHVGYITQSEFENNQKIIRKNAMAAGYDHRSPPREGPSLLQGLVVCGRCGKRMTLRYHVRNGKKIPDYLCQAKGVENAIPLCQSINGKNIDQFIADLIVKEMTPEAIDLVLSFEENLRLKNIEVKDLLKMAVQKSKYEADLAQRRYMLIDPENRLVARTLEASWNEKLLSFTEAEENFKKYQKQMENDLDINLKKEFRNIPDQFKVIWDNSRTSDKDKKRMIQFILEDVTLLKKDKYVNLKIRFKGGKIQDHTIKLPPPSWIQHKTSEKIISEIDELLDRYTLMMHKICQK